MQIRRIIFDKSAIEAMGNNYLKYGIISSTNNNNTTLYTTILPDILHGSLFYGLHSFTITTDLSRLNFNSSYNVSTGFLGYTSVYSKIKFNFLHYK